MDSNTLAVKLREMVQRHGGKAYPAVHLFGIEFADQLDGHNLGEICENSGLSKNYSTEISKGRKLAAFVTLDRTPRTD